MKKLFTFLLFTAIPQKNYGQSMDSINIKRNFILKTTPSYIFDFDNTFTLGAERFYANNKSIQAEFGYGNSNQNLLVGITNGFYYGENDEYRNFNNYRIKLEHKRYFLNSNSTQIEGSYFGFEVFSKIITKKSDIPVGRNVINNRPEYYENLPVNYKKFVIGSHLKLGHQFYIFDDNVKRKSALLADIYVGLGFRRIQNTISYDSKRENDFEPNNFETFGSVLTGPGKNYIVSATLGFKLGYVIPTRKRKS